VWKGRHKTIWQFVVYLLVGLITTGVELTSFSLLNFLVFVSFRDQPFSWWIINYSIESGGLTAFLAFAGSFAIAQTFNFFLQRKATFKANNNVAKSAVMYAIMIILVYFLQIYLPTLIRARMVSVLGTTIGDIATLMINMSVSMLIQFPVSKWLIMRRVQRI
jgi:putative flippase GtrA